MSSKIYCVLAQILHIKSIGRYIIMLFLTGHKKDGTKSISMVDFLSYNMEGALIVNIELPPLGDDYQFMSYKVLLIYYLTIVI